MGSSCGLILESQYVLCSVAHFCMCHSDVDTPRSGNLPSDQSHAQDADVQAADAVRKRKRPACHEEQDYRGKASLPSSTQYHCSLDGTLTSTRC